MTGIELIAEERQQQVDQHGFNEVHDDGNNGGELIKAALFLQTMDADHWPPNWDKKWMDKVLNKSRLEQFVVAGALIAAEIDRLQRDC